MMFFGITDLNWDEQKNQRYQSSILKRSKIKSEFYNPAHHRTVFVQYGKVCNDWQCILSSHTSGIKFKKITLSEPAQWRWGWISELCCIRHSNLWLTCLLHYASAKSCLFKLFVLLGWFCSHYEIAEITEWRWRGCSLCWLLPSCCNVQLNSMFGSVCFYIGLTHVFLERWLCKSPLTGTFVQTAANEYRQWAGGLESNRGYN